jgi:hypothetical protein
MNQGTVLKITLFAIIARHDPLAYIWLNDGQTHNQGDWA